MPQCTVNVVVDQKWVDQYGQDGTNLCMAKWVCDPCVGYNVVAIVKPVERLIQVSWEEKYAMAFSEKACEPGAMIHAYIERKNVRLGDRYVLFEYMGPDPVVFNHCYLNPKREIGFMADETCTPILYIKTSDWFVPVWVSEGQVEPLTDVIVAPTSRVVFWWQRDVECGTMISDRSAATTTVNVRPGKPVTLSYNRDGHWENDYYQIDHKARKPVDAEGVYQIDLDTLIVEQARQYSGSDP